MALEFDFDPGIKGLSASIKGTTLVIASLADSTNAVGFDLGSDLGKAIELGDEISALVTLAFEAGVKSTSTIVPKVPPTYRTSQTQQQQATEPSLADAVVTYIDEDGTASPVTPIIDASDAAKLNPEDDTTMPDDKPYLSTDSVAPQTPDVLNPTPEQQLEATEEQAVPQSATSAPQPEPLSYETDAPQTPDVLNPTPEQQLEATEDAVAEKEDAEAEAEEEVTDEEA